MAGSSAPTETKSTVTQTNLPDWLKGPVLDAVSQAQGINQQPYSPYPNQRIAGFTPAEQQVQQNVLGMGAPNQFAVGSGLAAAAGQESLARSQYTPTQFQSGMIQAGLAPGATMQAAQTDYNPNLTYFQMGGPGTFGSEQATQFMSPYMQQVVDVQKREALRDAQIGQLGANLGAARQGTYGGARQALMQAERERNLGTQLGQIQATGQQAAFQQAQQQFNTEQALRQQAAAQNLGAALGVQQLGTQTGTQVALANLDARQQANVQNLASELQTQGLNAEQAMRAALANQQSSLEAQRLGEQSRQFGAQQGLAALAQAGQMGQTLGSLGTAQQQADLSRLSAQQQAASMPRTMAQQELDMAYQDFLRQRDYPKEQLAFLSSIIRGLPTPIASTSTTYQQGPSGSQQVLGTGLGLLGTYKSLTGG